MPYTRTVGWPCGVAQAEPAAPPTRRGHSGGRTGVRAAGAINPTFLTASGSPVIAGAQFTMPVSATAGVYVNNGIIPNSDTGKFCVGFKLVSGSANVTNILAGFKRLTQYANTSTFYSVAQKIQAAGNDQHYNSISGNNGPILDQSPDVVFSDGDIFISCIDTGLSKAYHYCSSVGWLTQNSGALGGDPNGGGAGFSMLGDTIEVCPKIQVVNGAGGASEWEYLSKGDIPAGFTLMTAGTP